MAENGKKRLKNRRKWAEHVRKMTKKWTENKPKNGPQMDENGQKWPKMGENGRQWPKMGENGRKWPKWAENGQLETVRTLDLPAGGTLAKRRPLCVDGYYEKTACE